MKFILALVLLIGCTIDKNGDLKIAEDVAPIDATCLECFIDENCIDPMRQSCVANVCSDVDWATVIVNDHELNFKNGMSRTADSEITIEMVGASLSDVSLELWDSSIPIELQGDYTGIQGFHKTSPSSGHISTKLRKNTGEHIDIDIFFGHSKRKLTDAEDNE